LKDTATVVVTILLAALFTFAASIKTGRRHLDAHRLM
jgi:hypothetical protein